MKIFKLLLFIVIVFSNNVFSFTEKDVMDIILEAYEKCSSCSSDDPLYENIRAMSELLKKVAYAGKPKEIIFLDEKVVYMCPLQTV